MGIRVAATQIIVEQYKRRFVVYSFLFLPLCGFLGGDEFLVKQCGSQWSLPFLEGTQLWYPLSRVLLSERMRWHRQASHKSMQLSRCQAAGTARAWHWYWRAVETTAEWGATRSDGRFVQPRCRANRGDRNVKNSQGLRAEDWMVEPFPTIPENMHQPAPSPEGKNSLPSSPPAWRRGEFRGDKGTVNQISVRGSRWIPS